MRYDIDGWGAPALFARIEKQRKMARAKRIREAAYAPCQSPPPVDVFRTKSGYLAYSKFKPNLMHLGLLNSSRNEGEYVTLPWVSILGSR